MGDMSATVLAAGEGGTSNFLVPNGTFFVVLIIFLIVLGVIGTFVVPPVMKVLGERENMVTKTTEINRKAAQLFAAAETDYQELMKQARSEATGIREDARAEGRKILEEMRARAAEEVAATLQAAQEQMKQQADAIAADLRSSVEKLAAALASRVLGVEVGAKTATTAPGR
jgi:F-type H+-transporting ATPase subunit b